VEFAFQCLLRHELQQLFVLTERRRIKLLLTDDPSHVSFQNLYFDFMPGDFLPVHLSFCLFKAAHQFEYISVQAHELEVCLQSVFHSKLSELLVETSLYRRWNMAQLAVEGLEREI